MISYQYFTHLKIKDYNNCVQLINTLIQEHTFYSTTTNYSVQGNKTTGLEKDKENFNQLMIELKQAFDGKYLLTLATGGGKGIIDDCEYHFFEGTIKSNLFLPHYSQKLI